MFYLLDTYLNTPDKFLNETPLHFASKVGSQNIVELLTSYPECNRERKNNKGEIPADVNMKPYLRRDRTRNLSSFKNKKKLIGKLLKSDRLREL